MADIAGALTEVESPATAAAEETTPPASEPTTEATTSAETAESPAEASSDAEDLSDLPEDTASVVRARLSKIAEQRRTAEAEASALRQQLDAYKGFDPVIEQLKAQGFTDAQAVQARLQQEQQQTLLERQQQQAMYDAYAQVDQQVERGEVPPDLADMIKELRASQAAERVRGDNLAQAQQMQAFEYALNQELARPANSGVPRDLVISLVSQGVPLDVAAQRAGAQVQAIREAAITDYLKQNPQGPAQAAAPAPMPGGGAQQPGTAPNPDRKYSLSEALALDRPIRG